MARSIRPLLPFALLAGVLPSGAEAAVSDCAAAKIAEVLEAASDQKPDVRLDCNLKLDRSSYIITKHVEIRGGAASGLTFDCNGSTIRPTSSKGNDDSLLVDSTHNADDTWSRPENVTVKNCVIYGSVRLKGMASNGEGRFLLASSRSAGHTARAQDNAPRNITLDNLTIVGRGRVAVYFAPGVTDSSLVNSELKGTGTSVAMYLDAESARNTIRDNYVHVATDSREQLAVDGSAYNKIIGNRFSALDHGGIYLYRNCGEGHTIRHQAPQHNQIIANVFYYDRYDGELPSIWVASRNGHRDYCDDDNGYPYGSSESNLDDARYNVIAENQIYKLSASKMIRLDASPNYLFYNETVAASSARTPGCFFDWGAAKVFVRDGDYAGRRASRGRDLTSGARYHCSNNSLATTTTAPTQMVAFECAKSDSNAGCSKSISCPSNKKVVGLRAACNLEYGPVADGALEDVPWDDLEVVRASDNVSDGECRVGAVSISNGEAPLDSLLGGRTGFDIRCSEHDQNGGDCVIRGEALCL